MLLPKGFMLLSFITSQALAEERPITQALWGQCTTLPDGVELSTGLPLNTTACSSWTRPGGDKSSVGILWERLQDDIGVFYQSNCKPGPKPAWMFSRPDHNTKHKCYWDQKKPDQKDPTYEAWKVGSTWASVRAFKKNPNGDFYLDGIDGITGIIPMDSNRIILDT